jgi:hypothetical protein
MRALTDRDQLAAMFRAAGGHIESAIAGLTDEQMERAEIGRWSAKDHLTHLAIWHELRFFEINRIARGGGPALNMSQEQVDQLNELMGAPRRNLTAAQVIDDLRAARALIMDVIANAPEAALDETLYGEVGLAGGAEHDHEHASAIEAWRGADGTPE